MWKLAAINFGIQCSGWAVASILKSEKFYDLTGSLTYILLTGQSYWNIPRPDKVQKIQTACVITWATRLGSFLFYRIVKDGGDRRFHEIKHSPLKFLAAWTLQGVWIMITLYPTLKLLSNSSASSSSVPLRAQIGFGLWTFGFVVESLADHQKLRFKENPANAGMFIQSGLWRYSRHPNYFGEVVMWFGLWLSSSCKYTQPIEYLSIACPLFDFLLISKISGVPMLESHANDKWGHLTEYQKYVQNTSIMIPFIW